MKELLVELRNAVAGLLEPVARLIVTLGVLLFGVAVYGYGFYLAWYFILRD